MSYEIKITNNGKEIPKLIVENKITLKKFKLLGAIDINGITKLVIKNKYDKIVITFKALKQKYNSIGYYD